MHDVTSRKMTLTPNRVVVSLLRRYLHLLRWYALAAGLLWRFELIT
jgi:hypothetical protein